MGLYALLHVGTDVSIPTWYSSFALLLCAFLLLIIGKAKNSVRALYSRHWTALGWIFLALSVDEVAGIHETIGRNVRSVVTLSGVLNYHWVVVGIPFVLVLAVAYLRFLFHLPVKTRNLFVISAVLFVAGALGMEMYNARYDYLHGFDNLHYWTMTGFEEFLEKLGVVVFIYTLLDYMEAHVPLVELRFGRHQASGRPVSPCTTNSLIRDR